MLQYSPQPTILFAMSKKSKMEIPKRQERLCLHLPDSDGSHSVGFPGDANGAAITKTLPSYKKSGGNLKKKKNRKKLRQILQGRKMNL